MSAAGERGFTLLEMLVVLACLGLIAGLVWPALGAAMRGQSLRTAAQGAEATLAGARARAIRGAAPVTLAAAGFGTLSSGIAIGTVPAGGIGFFADGSSTGGTIDLTGAGGGARIAVSLTGTARLVPR